MARRIYITGASGSGVTTLGAGLSKSLNLNHVDVDDFYWMPTDPPFTDKRLPAIRVTEINKVLGNDGWVLTGSFDGWGDTLIENVDLVVFLKAPTDVRINRLRSRERMLFGDRIEPGGDMFEGHNAFVDWASHYDASDFSGRNLKRHEDWLSRLDYPVLRLDGTKAETDLIKLTMGALGG